MLMYKVIKEFTDLQDENYHYKEGDIYPREGSVALPKRIAQLSSKLNRQGVPLIIEEGKTDVSTEETLNPAIPVQSEKAEQETPSINEAEQETLFMNKPEVVEDPVKEVEKPKKRGRKKED